MLSLNDAIQLIRQGRKEEARQILEPLLKAETGNIPAWFWYVETCSTPEKRIQVLEVCLKMNPGNAQVMQALLTLRNQRPPQAPLTQTPIQTPKPAVSQPLQTSSQYSAASENKPTDSPVSSYTSLYFDDAPDYSPPIEDVTPQKSQGKQKKAWEEDYSSYEDTSLLSKPKPKPKSYSFFDAWMMTLTSMDIESYESVLNDPEAGAGRAFEWIAYTGIISGLIFPLGLVSNPQFSRLMEMPEAASLLGSNGIAVITLFLALAMAVVMPIFSMIGLAISAGIQNFLAILYGGNGNYGRTLYALAAYAAPMSIIISVLGIIPLVGQCLTGLVGLYNIVLNVRALRAAHSITVWQAFAVMLTPFILAIIFGCVAALVIGLPDLPR